MEIVNGLMIFFKIAFAVLAILGILFVFTLILGIYLYNKED